jgi:hypothetical protein
MLLQLHPKQVEEGAFKEAGIQGSHFHNSIRESFIQDGTGSTKDTPTTPCSNCPPLGPDKAPAMMNSNLAPQLTYYISWR